MALERDARRGLLVSSILQMGNLNLTEILKKKQETETNQLKQAKYCLQCVQKLDTS